MPRRSPTPLDQPPLNAGSRSVSALAVGLVVGVLVGVGWAVALGGGAIDWLAAGFAAGAVGCLVCLMADAVVDRLRVGGGMSGLDTDRPPPDWANVARTESRQHAERVAALADGMGDPYLSVQRYVSEFFRRANGWVTETNRRLQRRFPLVAVVAVCGVLAAVCRMTPERAREWAFVDLGWPAVLAAVLATLAGMELLSRGRRWERVFAAWREWATDSETPQLPPPSPAVELVKVPPPKKPPVPPPPPPPVVELIVPSPSPLSPAKSVSPPPPPPPPVPSAFERLKNLDLNPAPADDNDSK
jgi:hypothetical protein